MRRVNKQNSIASILKYNSIGILIVCNITEIKKSLWHKTCEQLGGNDGTCVLSGGLAVCMAYDTGMQPP